MSLRAEQARPHDLDGAVALLVRSGLAEHGVARGWGHFFVVREDDGRVVGVAGLEVHGEDGLLRSLAVEPAYRGQGLGAALVEAVVERARLLELRSLWLLTTTARDYLLRLGFAVAQRAQAPAAVGDSWEFRTGCPQTAVVMTRRVR